MIMYCITRILAAERASSPYYRGSKVVEAGVKLLEDCLLTRTRKRDSSEANHTYQIS